MSTTDPIDFKQIEEYLINFGEGEVILSNKYFDRGLAVVYLNNPGKKNAFSGRMMVKLRHCVEQLEQWKEGKAVLLCGLGGNFCSGGDLDFAKASGTQREALNMSIWMQDTLKRLQQLPMISICLVQGPTLGGGAEISVWCDYIVAAADVRYGFVHGKMGIITAWGGTTRLVEKVGQRKALDLLLTSEVLKAEKCVEYGLADFTVPVADCFTRTLEWIETRTRHHFSVIRKFKEVTNKAVADSFENSLEFEKNLFSFTWGSDINKEALSKNIKHCKNGNSKM